MFHQDFGSGRERMVQMSSEVAHNRLEGQLARARLSKGVGLEEAVPRKRGLAARSAAVVMALFR